MRYILLTGVLLANVFSLSAQELSATDSSEIRQQALRHVRQFEGLLNLVAQPDKYFRKYSFAKLIQSFYLEQSSYQIFRDSLVAVEDDLNPKAQPDDDNFLPIKDYLKAFFSFYEKSPFASVFFSNYEVSPVKQEEFRYVEVFYESEFTNRHRAYPEQPYPVRYHKATLRAQREGDGWQVIISNINYHQSDQPPVTLLADNTSTDSAALYQSNVSPLSRPEGKSASPSVVLREKEAESVENLSRTLEDSSATWEILDRLDRSSDFQLRLYESISASKPADQLPLVNNPIVANTEATQVNATEIYKRFIPVIRRTGASTVQVAFDNPGDDSLSVELISKDQEVLFRDKVTGEESYAKAINLENLEKEVYQVRVSNGDYDHQVRVDYPSVKSDTAPQENEGAPEDFMPYVLKNDGQSSVQVVFKNTFDKPLAVELLDTRGRVMYSEKVAGGETYGRTISLENLTSGSYLVKISKNDYQHAVRLYY